MMIYFVAFCLAVVVFCIIVVYAVCKLAWKIVWSILDSHEKYLQICTDEIRKLREEVKLLREELPWACMMTTREIEDDRSSRNGPTPPA